MPAPAPDGTRARALIEALAAVAPRSSPDDRAEKRRLLDSLAGRRIGHPAVLLRFHETLCLLQAYPDDREILTRVDSALSTFPDRVQQLGGGARARLRESGIVGTSLEYPFGLPMARWLAARHPREVEVAWASFVEDERLEDVLTLLVARAEEDAFTEGGLGWRQWIRAAKGGRRVSDLRVLAELFGQAELPEEVRDWLFEGLGLSIRWRLRTLAASRTGARLPCPAPFFGPPASSPAGFDLVRAVTAPLAQPRRVAGPEADALIEAARLAMATRARELHAFSHPNADDVLLADCGRGLTVALIGLDPAWRLPFEGYYAFFALRNGVPVGYGGGWCLFETMEFGFNIFESFRQGESRIVLAEVLRVFRRVFGIRTVVVDPYQIGHDNAEALRSGAFYFYYRLGFRPHDPEVLALAAHEQGKVARDRSYRSALPVLRRLVRGELALRLPGASPRPESRIRARQLATLATRDIGLRFAGDRAAATREATGRVGRALGAAGWRRWQPAGRGAFERWALVLALLPDLPRWPAAERRRVARMIQAKGEPGEAAYVRQMQALPRLRRALEALAREAAPVVARAAR
ncbi:MAG: hypothetical protein HYV93_21975 [Candidatus Rokubacteria bacterium]|nr:hypothetical protein [Candidatus Rokubacteria bacterium]